MQLKSYMQAQISQVYFFVASIGHGKKRRYLLYK